MLFKFIPSVCQLGVLSAAYQEPKGRKPFDLDPLAAALDVTCNYWIPLAGRHNLTLELGGAFFVADGYIPPEKMLDPVAPHVPVRTPKSGPGTDLSPAHRDAIRDACARHNTTVKTIGFFDNLLHDDDVIRAQIHEHAKRQGRAAVALGADGLTLFIGRNINLLLDANLPLVRDWVIPLFKYLVDLGLKVYLENCPMPGWNGRGLWVNNLASSPYMWVALNEMFRRAGIADSVFINFDASHTILQGGTVAQTFAYMEAAGLAKMIGRVHCKDQHRDPHLVAATEGRGQACLRGDWIGADPAAESDQWRAWLEMVAHHGMPGLKFYNPVAQLNGNEVDWVEHQYLLRALLGIDPKTFVVTLEHEWIPNRVGFGTPNVDERIEQMLALSSAAMRGADAYADAMFQSQAFVASHGISLPNEADDRFTRYRSKYADHANGIREQVSKLYMSA